MKQKRFERLRYWLRPPRTLKVTKVGRTYLLVTVGVGLGALNTGNNLLYLVLGLLLSVIVASGVLSERVLRRVHIRRLGTESAYAEEALSYRWALSTGSVDGLALMVKERDSNFTTQGRVGYIPAGTEHIVKATAVAPRRGPWELCDVEVSTRYPLGLFEKGRLFSLPGSVLVYPRRMKERVRAIEGVLAPQGNHGKDARPGGQGDLLELVALREGEDARRVYWAKSAALGQLVRAEREREAKQSYLLKLSPTGSRDRDDMLCEIAAAQANQLLSLGHQVGVEVGEVSLRPESGGVHERRILEALARLGLDRA